MSAPTATIEPALEAPTRRLEGNGLLGAGSMPAPGAYPVPTHHRKGVVERDWDGQVWTDRFVPAAAGTRLPHHKRHLLGFLRDQGWKLTLAFVLCIGIASALWAKDTDAHVVSGIQLLLPVFSFAATAIMMAAFLYFIGRRVGFDRIAVETRREIFRWGAASAVIGFGFAFAIEAGVPLLFGSTVKHSGWSVLAGPAEETGKLLVPAILWYRGRFRLPREGYLLVLVAACGFGVMEGCEYAFGPDNWQPVRPVFELLHPLLTGFVAAVAWQVAWRRQHPGSFGRAGKAAGKATLFTGAAIGAWCIAMLAHSTNDFIVLDKSVVKALSGISIFVAVLMYALQKHAARQLVPPDKVAGVSPRWRPAAPRRSD